MVDWFSQTHTQRGNTPPPLTHTLSPTHNAPTPTLTLTHTHTHTLSPTHNTPPHAHTHPLTTLLTHSHTQPPTLTPTHTHTHPRTHTTPLTHSYTRPVTCAHTPSSTHADTPLHTLTTRTHTHTLTPLRRGSSLAQMIKPRLWVGRAAAGSQRVAEWPQGSGMGQGLSGFCEVVSRRAPGEGGFLFRQRGGSYLASSQAEQSGCSRGSERARGGGAVGGQGAAPRSRGISRSRINPDALPAPTRLARCSVSLPHLGSCPSPAWLQGATVMTGAVHMGSFTTGDIFLWHPKRRSRLWKTLFLVPLVIHSAFLCMGGAAGTFRFGGQRGQGVLEKLGPGGQEVDRSRWADYGLWGKVLGGWQ